MTEEELKAIEARERAVHSEYFEPGEDFKLMHEDVPALIAEVRQLQTLVDQRDEIADELNNVLVQAKVCEIEFRRLRDWQKRACEVLRATCQAHRKSAPGHRGFTGECLTCELLDSAEESQT